MLTSILFCGLNRFMAKRIFPGGVSIFPTTIRPSTFNPLPADELITRNGEKFVWLRTLPSTSINEGNLQLPGKNKGYNVTYEKSVRLPDEPLNINGLNGNILYTSYTPISKVHRVYLAYEGGEENLPVKGFGRDWIELQPGTNLVYHSNVNIAYDVQTFETKEIETELKENSENIDLGIYPYVIVKVHSIWLLMPNQTEWTELKDYSFGYLGINLKRVYPAGTKFKIEYDDYATLDVAYRTISLKEINEGNLPANTEVGDVDIVVGSNANLSKGDILIATRLEVVDKEIATYNIATGLYRLSKPPITSLIQVATDEREYNIDDFEIVGRMSVRLKGYTGIDIPKKIAVVYKHNPQFRIISMFDQGALASKPMPKKYVMRADSTNIVLV